MQSLLGILSLYLSLSLSRFEMVKSISQSSELNYFHRITQAVFGDVAQAALNVALEADLDGDDEIFNGNPLGSRKRARAALGSNRIESDVASG